MCRFCFLSISPEDYEINWINRNLTIIDFETRVRVVYDEHGNRQEDFLGCDIYNYIIFDIPNDESDEQFLPFFDSGIRNTFVPFLSTPQPTGTLVGGSSFRPNASHRYIGLWVVGLPVGMTNIDVFFTNAAGDDRIIFWGAPLFSMVRHRHRHSTHLYSARVSTRTRSGNANLRFLSGNPVTITLNASGGSVSPGSIIRFSGMPIGELPIPTRTGRGFVGWFNTTAAVGGTRFHAGTFAPQSNTTLTARWHEPSRHQGWWWYRTGTTTAIPLGAFTINSSLGAVWRTSMNTGMTRWNSSAAPVSFNNNFTTNRVIAEPRTVGWFGLLDPRAATGRNLTRFDLILNSRTITAHAESNNFTLGNVITSVMAHELAHIIGLVDNPVGGGTSSLMSHYRNRNTVTGPTAFDITSVRMLYD